MAQGVATRQRMVDAAKDGFRTSGVTATGFTEIVERAGAARGAIYHHFPGGKAELIRTVIGSTADDVAGLIDDIFEAADSAVDAIAFMIELCALAAEANNGDFGCPITPAVLEAGGDESILQAGHAAFARWQERIVDGAVRKGATQGRAEDVAAVVIASIEGALVLSRAERSAQPLHRLSRTLPALLG